MRFGTSAVKRFVGLGAAFGMLLAVGAARAQGSCTFTDETGKTVTWPNCQPPAEGKTPAAAPAAGAPAAAPGASPAKSFPFPGETPAAVPNAPAAAAGGANGPAKSFPYPGDSSGGGGATPAAGGTPATPANGDGLQDAGSSGSSSSSSNSEGSDAGPLGGDDDPAAKSAEERRAERRRLASAPKQTPDEREVEDLKVAGFYQNDGNYKGAYDRATDAVSIAADDAEAHLALAEAARRLGKLDEAEKHYRKCLTLDPVPKVKKAAEKALKEMRGGG